MKTDRPSISARFDALRASDRHALVPYITAGHPDAERHERSRPENAEGCDLVVGARMPA